MPAGYSKRALIDKLGMKPNTRISILHAPEGFDRTLGPLPEGVTSVGRPTRDMDYIHAFFTEKHIMDRQFPPMKKALKENGVLWISWPKMAAKMKTDLTETVVREIGLRHGLVDVKVCAVDEVWSGLKFMYRIKDRARN
jgi:hypothetical protein